MGFTLITVTFTDENPDESPSQGQVSAMLSERISNAGVTIDPNPLVGSLNPAGALVNDAGQPFAVIANDDTGTTPTGSYYTFVIQVDNAPVRSFTATITHLAPGGTVSLTSLDPDTL